MGQPKYELLPSWVYTKSMGALMGAFSYLPISDVAHQTMKVRSLTPRSDDMALGRVQKVGDAQPSFPVVPGFLI